MAEIIKRTVIDPYYTRLYHATVVDKARDYLITRDQARSLDHSLVVAIRDFSFSIRRDRNAAN